MAHIKNNRKERPTLGSVKLSARRNKVFAVVFSLVVLTSACVWAYSLRSLSAAGVALLLFSIAGGLFYRIQKRENESLQREVAEHKKTKESLEEARAGLEQRTAELRRANEEVLRINDTVQGNIGRDLHDGLLQQLTGLTYFSDTLAENLAEAASPCVDGAHEISEHLRRLTSWIRDLAKGLYPTDLDNIGLAPALERLASTTAHLFSTSVVFECNEPVTVSNRQVALHLYRIAQEAVNNAVKHSGAKHIHIGLNRSGDTIVLTVKDDGSGFSPEKAAAGMGLQTIHFRGKAIGAVVDVKSDAGKGTIVSCSFQESDKS